METLKREYFKLHWRNPHHSWKKDKIKEMIEKKKKLNSIKTEVVEVKVPKLDPEPTAPAIDPVVAQLFQWQQELMKKMIESVDELKEQIKAQTPVTPEEAKDIFNENLKESHFQSKYTYEIYALKRVAGDGSEERDLTGHQFSTKEEAIEYGETHFKTAKGGKARYKILTIKKPYLVKNNE